MPGIFPLGNHVSIHSELQEQYLNGPRNLYVGGVTNVRDIGGYTTLSGDTVRQGRIIRCGKLHSSDGTQRISAKGIAQMRDDLGVKSEIDLRKASSNEYGGVTNSMLGADVNYFLLSSVL